MYIKLLLERRIRKLFVPQQVPRLLQKRTESPVETKSSDRSTRKELELKIRERIDFPSPPPSKKKF